MPYYNLARIRKLQMFESDFTLPQFDFLPVGGVNLLFSRGSIQVDFIQDFPLWWKSLSACLSSDSQVWILPYWGRKTPLTTTEHKREIVCNTLARDNIRIIPAPTWTGSYNGSHLSEIWLRL